MKKDKKQKIKARQPAVLLVARVPEIKPPASHFVSELA